MSTSRGRVNNPMSRGHLIKFQTYQCSRVLLATLIPFGRFAKKVQTGEEPQQNKETILLAASRRAA